jgi:zinc transport system ATP-binding protein
MNTVPSIQLSNVWVRFGERIVLEDIHLSVEPKTIMTIVGPNGSGKTTLLNVLLGFVQPNRGSVHVLGQEPKQLHGQGLIGYLAQASRADYQFPIRVRDVVALSRYATKRPFHYLNLEDHRAIDAALDIVDMESHLDEHFGSLSGGQKQRVLIARALAMHPKILLLDEPSTGLDAVAQEQFYCILQNLRDELGLTIVMVSHDVGAVSGFTDQVACLNRKLHFHGAPGEGIPPEALEVVFGKNIQFVYHSPECQTCAKRSNTST